MILEFYLARKILARKQARFFKLISLITILGVAIGVMALLVVIAVMNGFDKELEEKIFGINSGLLIKKDPYIYDKDYSYLRDKLAAVEEIKGYTPIIMGNATIIAGENVINIFLKGVDLKTEVKVTRLGSYLKTQLNSLSDNEIIVGNVLADNLNLRIGSELVVLIPYSLKTYSFKVRGIFESGMYDYDLSLAYINLNTARKIFDINGFTAVEAKISNPYKAKFVKKKLIPYLVG
ncbi:MAG TPA: ABC transporter permease, partial [Candidatus Omnitrophica bacterium]|nr:ABC transporter permease [Candidatus Omnitrophota bacterium]